MQRTQAHALALLAIISVTPAGMSSAQEGHELDSVNRPPPSERAVVLTRPTIGGGSNRCTDDVFTIEPVEIENLPSGPGFGSVRILMTNPCGPADGFVLAIAHDPAVVNLLDIHIDDTVTSAMGVELAVPELNPMGGTGGTLGVVMDFAPPFTGRTIPVGVDQHIATFNYECNDGSTEPVVTELTWIDGVLDDPPLDNILIIEGQSVSPKLTNGTITCLPGTVVDDFSTQFLCGVRDGFYGDIHDAQGWMGGTVTLGFFYVEGVDPNPDDGAPECVGHNIQAFQLAVSYDCHLEFFADTFTVAQSILGAIGAEFIDVNVDNDPHDGDEMCDLTIGILLDALPPFNAQTAPQTCDPLLIGTIDARIKEYTPCGECLRVAFQDGVDGGETNPLNNVVAIENGSVQGFPTVGCSVCVGVMPEFTRGDCNGDMKVDFGDAGAIIDFLQGATFPCEDACDANDDGKINFTDQVYLLAFLSESGPPPPDPGPNSLTPGPDPTVDELGCESGEACH